MSSRFNHNKRRNSGISYELLVRHMAGQMIDEDVVGTSQTLKIIKEHFSPGKLLAAERELFETIIATRGANESVARRILGEIARAASAFDARRLDIQKSNLIKEVHHLYGREFFDKYRIPQYRLLASIQMYLDSCRGKGYLSESVERIHLEEGIVQWMTTSVAPVQSFNVDRDIDDLVVRLSAKKFEEKYGKSFTDRQRALLETYSRSILDGNLDAAAKKMFVDRNTILEVYQKSLDKKEFREDKVMNERFVQAHDRLKGLDYKKVNDERVEELLLHWTLVSELESNE